MKLITVTLNPAVDATVTLDRLERGYVHRAKSIRHDAGGKGVNVASCLADWGLDVAATGLLGRENAGVFEALFRAKRIEDRFVRADGATRTNIKLVDSDATTDINLPGLTATGELLTEAEVTLLTLAEPGALVVLAGSLPLGCPPDHYGRLIARLQSRGVRVLLDTSGDALADALAGPALPWAIKPNRDELAEWAGQPLNTVRHIAAQAQRLREQGLGLVAVSMGEQGALFATEHGVLHAQLPATAVTSTVGAGDAMVAGIAAALAEQADTERVARLAVAFAVAKLGLAGPNLPSATIVADLAERVSLRPISTPGNQA